jgi:hypothetical protein
VFHDVEPIYPVAFRLELVLHPRKDTAGISLLSGTPQDAGNDHVYLLFISSTVIVTRLEIGGILKPKLYSTSSLPIPYPLPQA